MVKILVTGARGMVGKSICEHIDASNHEILKPSKLELNLLDPISTKNFLRNTKPQLIIHAAGVVGGIEANIKEPKKYFYDNLQIGLNLINYSQELGINNFLNIASSCMFPRDAENPLTEDLILKGELEPTNEGYALAKICMERLCKYICSEDNSYLYKTIVPCNIYGKYDKFDLDVAHMLPSVIHRMHNAKKMNQNSIEIWGDGNARREFMYSEDLADAIWFCVNHISELPQTINIGMSVDYSIKEYYKEVASVIDFNCEYNFNLNKPTGMLKKLVDSSQINKLGWKPKFNLNKGIESTYKYFLSHYKN